MTQVAVKMMTIVTRYDKLKSGGLIGCEGRPMREGLFDV